MAQYNGNWYPPTFGMWIVRVRVTSAPQFDINQNYANDVSCFGFWLIFYNGSTFYYIEMYNIMDELIKKMLVIMR